MEFSRVYWSSIWWRRGDLNPRPSVRGLEIYMFSVVYWVSPYLPDGQGE